MVVKLPDFLDMYVHIYLLPLSVENIKAVDISYLHTVTAKPNTEV